MAVTTLLADSSILIEHAVDVAVHPETGEATRIATRPYRLRWRAPVGAYPDVCTWSTAHYKYRSHRDARARMELRAGREIQAWDFPAEPRTQPIMRDRTASADYKKRTRSGTCWRANRTWRWSESAGWH